MKRKRRLKSRKSAELVNRSEIRGAGSFTFWNGDRYEGEYKLLPEQLALVKQGRGIYFTDDFNRYECEWNDDNIADGEAVICHNNGAQYKGGIRDGEINGKGIYTFSDGSSIEAIWFKNKPFEGILFKEPRGFPWIVEDLSQNKISFIPENYFWREACETMPVDSTTTFYGSQEELN